MRFLHLADLHLGKSIYGVSLLEEDQTVWVARFLDLTDETRPDAVLIAGDVYDRSAPSGEAVALLDRLLTGLSDRRIPVCLISGNHDSGRRLAFASSLLARQGVHIAGEIPADGILNHVTFTDAYGPVTVWLMPYLFPLQISELLGDEEIRDYETAVRRLLALQPLDPSQRNILVAHQNVTAFGKEVQRGGSESMVGGIGQIDFHCFDAFDYVALGHIHAAYPVGRESVRYAGSPLCYHFDETRQTRKGPLLVTLGEKGTEAQIECRVIPPLHPMRVVEGPYNEIRTAESASDRRNEYLSITLTDRPVTAEISTYLHSLYEARGSSLLELTSSYRAFAGGAGSFLTSQAVQSRTVDELFSDFYTERNNGTLPTEGERNFLAQAAELMNAPGLDFHTEPDQGQIERLLEELLAGTEREAKET